jgi:hypothetical protein
MMGGVMSDRKATWRNCIRTWLIFNNYTYVGYIDNFQAHSCPDKGKGRLITITLDAILKLII